MPNDLGQTTHVMAQTADCHGMLSTFVPLGKPFVLRLAVGFVVLAGILGVSEARGMVLGAAAGVALVATHSTRTQRSQRIEDEAGGLSVAVVQCVLPAYRVRFFEMIEERVGQLQLIAGFSSFEQSVKTSPKAVARFGEVNAPLVFFFGRRLAWQRRVLTRLAKFDCVVLEMNPRLISTWLSLLLLRIRGARTLVWGHATSRRGDRVGVGRRIMFELAHGVVCYTELEAAVVSKNTRTPVFVAPNALYSRDELPPPTFDTDRTDIVYVGRLSADKEIMVLLHAFAEAVTDLPATTRLVLVGDGPCRDEIFDFTRKMCLESRVEILDEIFEPASLVSIYSRAVLAVSPGFAGLSATQALGFGLPIAAPRTDNHAPELNVAVAVDAVRWFMHGSVSDLADVIRRSMSERPYDLGFHEEICDKYNLESMAAGFADAIFDSGPVYLRQTRPQL